MAFVTPLVFIEIFSAFFAKFYVNYFTQYVVIGFMTSNIGNEIKFVFEKKIIENGTAYFVILNELKLTVMHILFKTNLLKSSSHQTQQDTNNIKT